MWLGVLLLLSLMIIGCGEDTVTGGTAVDMETAVDTGTVTVIVRSENGSLMGDVDVYADSELIGKTRAFGESKGTKTFILGEGDTLVRAEKEGFVSTEDTVVEFRSGSQTLTLDLIPVKTFYNVKVSNDFDKSLEGAMVKLSSNDKIKFSKIVSTNSFGFGKFGGVNPGDYTLTVSKPGYETSIEDIEVPQVSEESDRLLEVTLHFIPDVRVKVLDDYGERLEGAEVTVYTKKEFNSPDGRALDVYSTDEEGLVDLGQLLRGLDYVLVVRSNGYKAALLELTVEGKAQVVTVEMKKE